MMHIHSRLAFPFLAGFAVTLAAVSPALPAQEMPQPAKQNLELVEEVGDWTGTIQLFMPGMPSEAVAASQRVEAVGQFWIHTRFKSTFMGQPYVGTGSTGYDAATKKYVGTWVDSHSSYLAVMEGEKDAKTGALVMRWKAPDMTGAMQQHRSESVTEAGVQTMTFYMGEGDAAEKMMVIKMRRVASDKPASAPAIPRRAGK